MEFKQELIDFLAASGLRCSHAFPNLKMPVLEASMITVGTKSLSVTPGVLNNLFGTDGEDIYWCAHCREELFLDLFSPYLRGGIEAERYIERVLRTVFGCISHQYFTSIQRGENYYDPKTDCFRCHIGITVERWIRLMEE